MPSFEALEAAQEEALRRDAAQKTPRASGKTAFRLIIKQSWSRRRGKRARLRWKAYNRKLRGWKNLPKSFREIAQEKRSFQQARLQWEEVERCKRQQEEELEKGEKELERLNVRAGSWKRFPFSAANGMQVFQTSGPGAAFAARTALQREQEAEELAAQLSASSRRRKREAQKSDAAYEEAYRQYLYNAAEMIRAAAKAG